MPAERAIAALELPDLPVALARRADPRLHEQPVAVVRGAAVVAASPEARAAGIGPGSGADAAHGAATVVPFDADAVQQARAAVGRHLNDYTPRVEAAGTGVWYLDLAGTQAHFRRAPLDLLTEAAGDIAQDFRAPVRAALASGKAVARMAARVGGERVMRVLPGAEAAFMRELPGGLLPGLSRAQAAQLRRLGLHHLGDVAAMPVERLAAAFGPRGRLWAQWSRGQDPRPVAPWTEGDEQDALQVSQPLSGKEQSPAAVAPALLDAAETLGRRLRDRVERARRIAITVTYRDGAVRTRTTPLAATDRDFDLFEAFSALLAAAWTRRVALRHIRPSVAECQAGGQGDLFAGDGPMDRLQRSIDAVRDRFGTDAVQWGPRLGAGTALSEPP